MIHQFIRNNFNFFNSNKKNNINGNWSAIVAPQNVKTVEDNKELVLSARFNTTTVRFSCFFNEY